MADGEPAALAWLQKRSSERGSDASNDRRGEKPETVEGCVRGTKL
jgi:hypothetical protein